MKKRERRGSSVFGMDSHLAPLCVENATRFRADVLNAVHVACRIVSKQGTIADKEKVKRVTEARTWYEIGKSKHGWVGDWYVRPARTTQNGRSQAGQHVTQHARNAAAHRSCTSHTALACSSECATLRDVAE